MFKFLRKFSNMMVVRTIINLFLMKLTENMLEIVSIGDFAYRAKRVLGVWFWKANEAIFFTS